MNKRRAFNLKPLTLLLAALMVAAIVTMLLLKLDFNTIAAVTTLFALVVAISAMIAPSEGSDVKPAPLTLKEYAAVRRGNIERYEREYVQLRVDEILHSKFEGFTSLQRGLAIELEPTRSYPSIEAVITAHPKFVLLGNPGAGKSTLLRHIELKLLTKFAKDGGLFPLSINLGMESNPADPQALIEAECKRIAVTDDLKARLDSGGLFLLLDGLNEMPNDRIDRAKKLHGFLAHYRGKWIVACRETDYRDDLAFEKAQMQQINIAEIRVPPLKTEQVKDFINTLVAKHQLSSESAKEFIEQIYGAQGTVERQALATNPYALTMLLDLFTDPHYPFPETREQLYDIYIEKAYKDNQAGKRGETKVRTPFPKLKAGLQQLAYGMLVEGKGTSVDARWAAQYAAPSRKWLLGKLGINELYEERRLTKVSQLKTGTFVQRGREWVKIPLRNRLLGVVQLILQRQGNKLLHDAKSLLLTTQIKQSRQFQFFHESLYEQLALPLLNLHTGSLDQRRQLVARLGHLGATAKPALRKLTEAFLAESIEMHNDHIDLYIVFIEAYVQIGLGIWTIRPEANLLTVSFLLLMLTYDVAIQDSEPLLLYLIFSLAVVHNDNFDLNHSLQQALTSASDFDITLTSASDFASTSVRTLVSANDLASILSFTFALAIALMQAFVYTRAFGDGYTSVRPAPPRRPHVRGLNRHRTHALEIRRMFLETTGPHIGIEAELMLTNSEEARKLLHTKIRRLSEVLMQI
jgi:hypothetical protein